MRERTALPEGPKLHHVLRKAQCLFQAFYHHQAWATLFGVPQVGVIKHQIAWAQGEYGPPDWGHLRLVSFNLFRSPSVGRLLRLPFSYLGFFSQGLSDLPLLSLLGALAYLAPLPFLVRSIRGLHTRGDRSLRVRWHCNRKGRAPNVGRQ